MCRNRTDVETEGRSRTHRLVEFERTSLGDASETDGQSWYWQRVILLDLRDCLGRTSNGREEGGNGGEEEISK